MRIQLNYYRLCSGLKCSDLAAGCSLRRARNGWQPPVKPSYQLLSDQNTFVFAVYGPPRKGFALA